jgi:hypothetical protein
MKQPQLTLGADASNDVSLDDVLGPSRRVRPANALAVQAGPDGAVVAKRQANVRRGKTAQKHGAEFERWVLAQFEAMKFPGPGRLLAWGFHVEAEAKYCRDERGQKVLRHVAKAHADFVAMSTRAWGSRGVVIETKTVFGDGERFSLADLPEQQVRHLVETWREGGVSLLGLEFRTPGARGHVDVVRRFFCPWGEIPWRVGGRGGWSVGAADLVGFEAPPETGPKREYFLKRHIEAA